MYRYCYCTRLFSFFFLFCSVVLSSFPISHYLLNKGKCLWIAIITDFISSCLLSFLPSSFNLLTWFYSVLYKLARLSYWSITELFFFINFFCLLFFFSLYPLICKRWKMLINCCYRRVYFVLATSFLLFCFSFILSYFVSMFFFSSLLNNM